MTHRVPEPGAVYSKLPTAPDPNAPPRLLPCDVPEALLARLTPRQLVYVQLRASGYTGGASARGASYSGRFPHQTSYRLERSPRVRAVLDVIRKTAAAKATFDCATALGAASDAADLARRTADAPSLVKALTLKARLAGLLGRKQSEHA